MRHFWKFLYTVVLLPLLWLTLHVLSLVNPKVKRGIEGRRTLFIHLASRMAALPAGPRVWFHSSSLGEFEQAKPIIAELKRRKPAIRIIASFFSPSGLDHSRKYPHADIITYLPFDTPRYARRFITLAQPDAAVMVRYDVWPNMIWELHRQNVPTLIANATMRESSARLLPISRAFHRALYDCIDDILTVSAADAEAFHRFHLNHAHVEPIGDTRFDQVCTRSTEARKHHILPDSVAKGKKVVVAGSTWPEDEAVLLPAFLELRQHTGDVLLVLVPHEPTLEHIEDLEQQLSDVLPSLRFSALNEYNGESILIVDSVGILMRLYAAAHVAYVGGSFRQGIHNVIEAAVYGIPVIFGPRVENSQESRQLVEQGAAFIVDGSSHLHRIVSWLLSDESARANAGSRAAAYVQENKGATDRFLHHLEPYLQERDLK